MALLKEQERICTHIGSSNGLARSLINQALIHGRRGALRRALVVAKESLRIAETHELTALAQQIQPIPARIRNQASGRPQ